VIEEKPTAAICIMTLRNPVDLIRSQQLCGRTDERRQHRVEAAFGRLPTERLTGPADRCPALGCFDETIQLLEVAHGGPSVVA
jgi:hypothetical protein